MARRSKDRFDRRFLPQLHRILAGRLTRSVRGQILPFGFSGGGDHRWLRLAEGSGAGLRSFTLRAANFLDTDEAIPMENQNPVAAMMDPFRWVPDMPPSLGASPKG